MHLETHVIGNGPKGIRDVGKLNFVSCLEFEEENVSLREKRNSVAIGILCTHSFDPRIKPK